jgi:hypothetical protein
MAPERADILVVGVASRAQEIVAVKTLGNDTLGV